MHTLCERVERFLPELFVFVAYPGVPSDNNLAERSVRPLVIARKISGGTRSPKGSRDPHGTGESLRHLDGSRAQSFRSVSRSPDPQIFLRSKSEQYHGSKGLDSLHIKQPTAPRFSRW